MNRRQFLGFGLGVAGLALCQAARPGRLDAQRSPWRSLTLQRRTEYRVASVGEYALVAGGWGYEQTPASGPLVSFDVVDLYHGPSDQWSTAQLSEPRHAALVVRGRTRVAFLFGSDGGQYSDAVDVFDSATGTWLATRVPTHRVVLSGGESHMTIAGTRLVIAGGGGSNPPNAIDTLDLETGDWSTIPMAASPQKSRLVPAGPRALVLGTTDDGDSPVQVLDPASGQWNSAQLSTPRPSAQIVRQGSSVFVGFSPTQEAAETLDVLDGETGQWSVLRLPVARGRIAVVTPGHLVVQSAQGDEAPGTGRRIDVYSRETGAWSTGTLAAMRTINQVVAIGSKLVFVGDTREDVSPASTAHDVYEVYDVESGQWSSGQFGETRYRKPAIAAGSRLLFVRAGPSVNIPGLVGGSLFDSVDIYDSASNTWSTGQLSVARREFAVAVVGDKVLIAGGSVDVRNRTKRQHFDVVDIYDAGADAWTTGQLSMAREAPEVVVLGNRVLFIGGLIGCSSCPVDFLPPVVDIYDANV